MDVIVDKEANMDRCVAEDEHDHVCRDYADGAFLLNWVVIQLFQNTDDLSGTEHNDQQWSEETQKHNKKDKFTIKSVIFTSFITSPELFRGVVLSEYKTYRHKESPNDQTHNKSCLFLLPPWSGLYWEPYRQVALDTDGRRGHHAGVHVDVMYEYEESTKVSLWQAVEGIIDPEGNEEDEGKISYSQVEHVDMGVCPGAPLSNEGTQSSSIDEETQEKQNTVTNTLKRLQASSVGEDGDVDVAGGVGGVEGVVPHACL